MEVTRFELSIYEEISLLTVLYFPIFRVPEYSELSVAIYPILAFHRGELGIIKRARKVKSASSALYRRTEEVAGATRSSARSFALMPGTKLPRSTGLLFRVQRTHLLWMRSDAPEWIGRPCPNTAALKRSVATLTITPQGEERIYWGKDLPHATEDQNPRRRRAVPPAFCTRPD